MNITKKLTKLKKSFVKRKIALQSFINYCNYKITKDYKYKKFFDFVAKLYPESKLSMKQISYFLTLVKKAETYNSQNDILPPITQKTEKSILFMNQNYYQFFFLSKELKSRGYDSFQIQPDSKNSSENQFFYGADVYLYDEDASKHAQNWYKLYSVLLSKRFQWLWFYGRYIPQFDYLHPQWNIEKPNLPFLYLKFLGIKFGWIPSGCNDDIKQSSHYKASGGACEKCVLFDVPSACNDKLNESWAIYVKKIYDIIENSLRFITPECLDPKYINEFLTNCIDTDIWRPDLEIPSEFKIQKERGEILIIHSHGNAKFRINEKRSGIKGSKAVYEAEKKIKELGLNNVKFLYLTDVQSQNMKYYQVQADIAIDQLNAGVYGSTSRELLALGIPTICYIHPDLEKDYECIKEIPMISANEETLLEVLLDLIKNPEKLPEISKKSREYALKWHSTKSCADRLIKKIK